VNLPLAVRRLSEAGEIVGLSAVYASPAVGPAGQPDFVNAAVLLETSLAPDVLRRRLRRLEADMGRVRTGDRFAPRPIDLDLVLYNDLVSLEPALPLPDPDLLERAYLAVTIAELDPARPHPVTGEPLREIADRLRRGTSLARRDDLDLAGQA
jgi:2-amino-4-hydroxy-6-hydroxymethyldihydropteridine diphosphokinase